MLITRRLTSIASSACLLFSASLWAGPIGISELFYDAVGTDAPFAFTELYGAPGARLDGFALVGVNGATGRPYRTLELTGAVIPDDGFLVVATRRAAPALEAVRDFVANVDWQNGPDAVELRDAFGELVDALQYGDAGAGNAGKGRPAPDVPAGFSLARNAKLFDSGDNASDFWVASPTPGRGSASVPEPAFLGFLSLLAVMRTKRKRTAS